MFDLKLLQNYDPRAHGANCDACPCKNLKVVPPVKPDVDVPDAIIVGQEPGFLEVKRGKPFIGPSGKRLDYMLGKHKIDRSRLHITNAALCLAEEEADRIKAYKCCNKRLQNEIAEYATSVPVVPLGAFAFKNVLQNRVAITLARGFLWKGIDGRDVLPTLHPAYVLKDGLQWPLFSRDVRRISDRIKNGFLKLDQPPSYTIPRTLSQLKRVLKLFGKLVSCDIETTEEIPTKALLECIGISDGINTTVIPWHPNFAKVLHEFFKGRTVIFHNGFAFDTIVLTRFGIDIDLNSIEDTLIAHHVYASHMKQSLDYLVSFYLDAEPWKIKFGKRGNDEKGKHKKLTEAELFKYNALDAYLTFCLWKAMEKDVAPWLKLYQKDKNLAKLCRKMQISGSYVDIQLKEDLSKAIKEKEVRLYAKMKEQVGWEFSPTKPKDIRKILFDQFHAPIIERTKKTQMPATGKSVLLAFAVIEDKPYGEFSKDLVELRACSKMRVTYLDNLDVEKDGRVHASWRSFATPTSRFSCRNPNLMNLKKFDSRKKDEPEQKIRMIYIAPPGRKLVSFDLSQVEPRGAAYMSQDPTYIEAVESGDMHTYNARILFGDLPQLMDPVRAKKGDGFPMRDAAKKAGLALNYLAGADKLYHALIAEGYATKLGKVIEMLAKLHKRFKRYFEYVDENLEFCRKKGYIVTGYLTGRVRWLGHAPEASKIANTPIQGIAADIMNDKLVKIESRLEKEVPSSFLIGQIHDAGIFEIADNEQQENDMKNLIKNVLDEPIYIHGRRCIFSGEIKTGYKWSEI